MNSSFIQNIISMFTNSKLKKQILLTTLIILIFSGVAISIPALEKIYGVKNFVDGLQSNGATVATLDANSLLPIANTPDLHTNLDANSLTLTNASIDPNGTGTFVGLKIGSTNIYPPETTVELDDDETLTLPAITRGGILNVWTSTQYAEYFLKSDGSVEYIRMTSGCDDADTDVITICVYDGGTNSILKNRSGGTLTYGYTLVKN